MALGGVLDTLKLSREFALLGNYETALVYYDGVLSKVQQCVSASSARRRAPWPPCARCLSAL